MVPMCKMIISPFVFSIFQNFDFSGCWRGGESAKNDPKRQKNMSFQNFDFWVFRGVKGQKIT